MNNYFDAFFLKKCSFLQMLPVEITTEKSPEQDLGSCSESNEDTTEADENRGETVDNNDDVAENDEDNKTTDDKGPQQSPTPLSLWRPRLGMNKRPPGFQAPLCCSCVITGNDVPLCYLTMSSAFGM